MSRQILNFGGQFLRARGNPLAAYAAGGIKPATVLDFALDRYLGTVSAFSDLTFARASNATYIDADGILQTAASNVPRFDYSTGARRLLIEPTAATNLFVQSNDFTSGTGYWSLFNTSPANDATGPDDLSTSATTLRDNSAGGTNQVYVQRAITVSTSTTYTASIYAKADQLSWINFLTLDFTTPGNVNTSFNLSAGSVGTEGTGHTGRIEDVGGGWYRCSVTFTTDAADTAGSIRWRVGSGDGLFTVDLDGTSSILIYGAQFEAGSVPTSYIPTNGATATRAAETIAIPAAKIADYQTPTYIGDELVTNGTFDTDTDWVKGTGWTISGGQAVATAVASNVGMDTSAVLGVEIGKVYAVEYDVVSISSGAISVRFTGAIPVLGTTNASTPGAQREIFVAQDASAKLSIRTVGTTTATIDNVSIREINPLAVSFAMSGEMTYADTGAANVASLLLWQIDAAEKIETKLDCDIGSGQITTFQVSNSVTDLSDSASSFYSPGVNVPFNLATRHGSTFIQGAAGGTAFTENTTPVAFFDGSATDIQLAYSGGPIRIAKFIMWNEDLGTTGIEEASA